MAMQYNNSKSLIQRYKNLILGIVLVFTFSCSTKSGHSDSKTTTNANNEPTAKEEPSELLEKYWKLLELKDRKIAPTTEGNREAHLILKRDENLFKGNSGCNSFSGSYEVKGNNGITFSQIISTKMGCIGENNETEYFQILREVKQYSVRGDTLRLTDTQDNTQAKFVVVYL